MNALFDLRDPAHRSQIADALPIIDNINYSISREQFLDALAALIDHMPRNLALEYRSGYISIHSTGANLVDLVDLGLAFRTLKDCEGFDE